MKGSAADRFAGLYLEDPDFKPFAQLGLSLWSFLSQSKDMHVRSTRDHKLDVNVNDYLCQGVIPASHPVWAGIGLLPSNLQLGKGLRKVNWRGGGCEDMHGFAENSLNFTWNCSFICLMCVFGPFITQRVPLSFLSLLCLVWVFFILFSMCSLAVSPLHCRSCVLHLIPTDSVCL